MSHNSYEYVIQLQLQLQLYAIVYLIDIFRWNSIDSVQCTRLNKTNGE